MPETEHSQQNISYIRTHVDQIEQMTRFAIACNPNSAEFVKDYLKKRKGAPEVYLALGDGPKTLDEIKRKVRKSRGSVSLICTHLAKQGLISKVPNPDNSRSCKFSWNEIETMLGVSKIAKAIT